MSATGFHPEPSAKAPWTRTMVLTVAYAGDDTAKAAPVRRARIKRFMLQLHKIVPPHWFPRGTASRRLWLGELQQGFTAGGMDSGSLCTATLLSCQCPLWVKSGHWCASMMSALPPKADINDAMRNVRFVPKADKVLH